MQPGAALTPAYGCAASDATPRVAEMVADVAARMVAGVSGAMIDFAALSVTYRGNGALGAVHALQGIDLGIAEGEFVSLIGPSGCGKSTMLRIAADLLEPSGGRVRIAGVSPHEARLARRIGMVFQDPALLEWRSVIDNVLLPLELMGTPRKEARRRAREMIDLVGLAGFEQAPPRALSGGMRQRAALARAMVTSPAVLYMDEPFGALDQITRDRLNLELLTIVERHRITILFVTHSIREAVLLSDRVVVMSPRPGRITDIFEVGLPRPRHLGLRQGEAYEALVRQGTEALHGGILAHG